MSTVLLDVDGVICDFASKFCEIHAYLHGVKFKPEQITAWDFSSVATADETEEVFQWISENPGTVRYLKPYRGAIEAVNKLRNHGHRVVAVTTPRHDCTWAYERAQWLKQWWFKDEDIVFCHDKSLVCGDYFVDDRPENVINWGSRWGRDGAFLLNRPWNTKHHWRGINHLEEFAAILTGCTQGGE